MRAAFLELLNGGYPRQVVWTADITYWIEGRRVAGAARSEWDTEEGFLQLHRELGILPYYHYGRFFAFQPEYDGEIRVTRETRGAVTECRIATRRGDLTEEITWLPESACSGCTKHFVESERDLDILRHVLEHRRLVPAHLEDYFQRMALWEPYDGLPPIGLPRSPLPAFCCEWAGVQSMAFLLADCGDTVKAVLRLLEAQEEPVLEAVCRLAPPLVHFPDNLSSDNLGGLYEEYMEEGYRRRLERLHRAGIRAAVHLDGAVRGLLPKLAATGFDAVEALTPAPVGDVDVADMRALAGNETVILWGGVPGAMFAPPYTWERMRRHVEHLLECWAGERFVIGVADQVPPDGDIGFCRRIADLVAAHA